MSHTSEEILSKNIGSINIKPGDIYYHYRSPHDHYKVITIALDEATEKPVVVYQALYGKKLIWVRHYDVWCQNVEHNGEILKRFTKIC
ncbi:TonB box-like protein [Tupanvirus deep ocean]|uniref:TonB box-like protein n=2 Tax=Tupanvirus TaxID=2094720 RepID=A0AC62AAD5_9VIRU|nr:TonB box-like protein [Tupanvirus deep ocean]QKU34603.1 TonB box-like protein [Tupanvirus deep ocean]